MASEKPKPAREYVEIGVVPEYFVTEIRTEAVDAGNVRVYAYTQRGNEFHLLYTVIVPATKLTTMSRQCMAVAADAHNLAAFRDEIGTEH